MYGCMHVSVLQCVKPIVKDFFLLLFEQCRVLFATLNEI